MSQVWFILGSNQEGAWVDAAGEYHLALSADSSDLHHYSSRLWTHEATLCELNSEQRQGLGDISFYELENLILSLIKYLFSKAFDVEINTNPYPLAWPGTEESLSHPEHFYQMLGFPSTFFLKCNCHWHLLKCWWQSVSPLFWHNTSYFPKHCHIFYRIWFSIFKKNIELLNILFSPIVKNTSTSTEYWYLKSFKVFITFFHLFQFYLVYLVLDLLVGCFLMNYALLGILNDLSMLTFLIHLKQGKNKFRKSPSSQNQLKK